jgi:hypothetical protein
MLILILQKAKLIFLLNLRKYKNIAFLNLKNNLILNLELKWQIMEKIKKRKVVCI